MAIKFDTFTGGGAVGVTSVNGDTGPAVVLSADDLAADHAASNYSPTNSNIDGHLSGIDTKLGTLAAGLTYKGSFNATTQLPSLSNALQGDLYIIDTAGTAFGRIWAVGDHLLINEDIGGGVILNSKIDKIDNTDAITSVNGFTSGAIVLSADDLAADHAASNYSPTNSNIDGHLSGIDTTLGTKLESGDNISTLTNDAGYLTDITGESIGDLSDVTITAASTGEVLRYNGSAWVDATLAYSDLSGTPTNVSTFTNDAGYLTDITGESIGDLSDVTITTATNGQVLSYNGSAWVNSAASAGSLAGLTDTTITAPADGEYLRYNGSSWVDAALSVVDDTSPQLGGALDTNGNAITSASNADVSINPNGTGNISIGADLVPDADATHTIGSENNRYITTHSDLNGAVRFKAKNDEGAAITAGQALYIKGLAGDGTTPTVGLADANDASKMPAFGLAFAGANDQAEVQVVSFGNLGGLNTSTFSVGDTLYISTTAGALTATKPTGETSQLQNIGRVVRSNNGDGVINVGGAGRSAATPNLDQDKIFLGNASNQSVSTALSAIGLSKFNNDSAFISDITGESIGDLSDVTITTATNGQVLSYNGSAWVNSAASAGSLAGLSDVTITAASTGEVLRYNGSVWVDATLAYSDLSGTPTNVSTFTNDAGYLTGITGESIGDLSDVTITGAASGEVLRYNGSAWVDAVLAYSDLSGTPTNVSTFTNDAGYLTGITGESINDLSDVTITTATNGQVLTYNGSAWVNQASASASLAGLSDVTITAAATGEVLRYNGSVWVDAVLAYSDLSGTPTNVSTFTNDAGYLTGITGESIGDLSDVTITTASTGEVLRYNGSAWVDATLAYSDLSGTPTNVSTFTNDAGYLTDITGESIGDLSDVTITTATNGQVLTYNGSAWINQAVSISAPTVTAQNSTATLSTPSAGIIEEVYTVNSASAVTLTLVSAATVGEGFKYQIKRLGAGSVTVDPASTEYIDHSGQTTFSIGAQYDSITLISDGTNWLLI